VLGVWYKRLLDQKKRKKIKNIAGFLYQVANNLIIDHYRNKSKKPISLRVTTSLLAKVKMVANKRDIPYQTLMKQYILEKVEEELNKSSTPKT